jgi:hypothetical protein
MAAKVQLLERAAKDEGVAGLNGIPISWDFARHATCSVWMIREKLYEHLSERQSINPGKESGGLI